MKLGLLTPDPADSPVRAGVTMVLAFCVFGSILVLSFVVCYVLNLKGTPASTGMVQQFWVSCILTGVALLLLGWVQVTSGLHPVNFLSLSLSLSLTDTPSPSLDLQIETLRISH